MAKDYTVVVLGAGGVGKTSMISQFIRGHFPEVCNPTIEDCYRHIIKLPDGVYRNVNILDTAGSHQFPAMRELSIQLGQAFVLVFSINDEDSYEEAKRLGEHIIDIKGNGVPLVLVGNKSDLAGERDTPSNVAAEFVRNTLCSNYAETSAKYNVNIYELFLKVIMQALNIEEKPLLKKKGRYWSMKLHNGLLRPPRHRTIIKSHSADEYSSRRQFDEPNNQCVIL